MIVAHSVRSELERCLASIGEHAGVSVETILVDNASTDDTIPWVRQFHPYVDIVRLEKNVGVAARDYGLRHSRGRYTMFLDSDAALTTGALPRMVEALDAHPTWGLVGPRLVHPDGSVQMSARRYPPLLLPLIRRPPLRTFLENGKTVRHHLMREMDHGSTRPVLYVLGACQLFRTSLARIAGPFSDRVFLGWDDAEWCFRIRDAGGEIVFLGDATVVHDYRRLTNRQPVSRAAWRQLCAHVYFQRKFASRRSEFTRLERELDRISDPALDHSGWESG